MGRRAEKGREWGRGETRRVDRKEVGVEGEMATGRGRWAGGNGEGGDWEEQREGEMGRGQWEEGDGERGNERRGRRRSKRRGDFTDGYDGMPMWT